MRCVAADARGIAAAVRVLRQGGVVALPTETCYGLAVDPRNPEALRRLFALKGRSGDKPVLLLVGGRDEVACWAAEVDRSMARLMERLWPGPLTLVLPARPGLDSRITGQDAARVALRLSSHAAARALPRALGRAVTATSANSSGGVPPLEAKAVVQALGGREPDLIIDSGSPLPGGVSTIVGMQGGRPVLLRAGVLPFARVVAVAVTAGNSGSAGSAVPAVSAGPGHAAESSGPAAGSSGPARFTGPAGPDTPTSYRKPSP